MVVSTTKVKQAMGLTPKPKPNPKLKPKPKPITTSVPELLKLVEDLQSRESRLKAELAELNHRNHKSTSLVLALESNLVTKTRQIDTLSTRVADLEVANKELMNERLIMNAEFETKVRDYDVRIVELMNEVEHLNLSSQRYLGLVQVANKSNLIKNLGLNKSALSQSLSLPSSSSSSSENNVVVNSNVDDVVKFDCSNVVELAKDCCSSRVPRVPKPPPKRCFSKSAPAPPPMPITPPGAVMERTRVHPPPPPPPPGKCRAAKVKRVPEVVEFYHSLMRRDSRKENGAGIAEVTMTTAAARDLVGEIENRSAYSLAIKTDVETQGDFIKFLIKEVETAAFTDIEDVVSFVKWLDDELSYLVDERAVLKHFDWPEKKADGLREAAFEYSDLKKLESEASSFRQDTRQACSTTLKKMQTLLEKLEHGVYNLSRLRESATNRFKSFHIPVDWMLDAGFVSQIKLASVKLAMKFMKRVLAELEIVCGGPEEEELIVQGVRFAFRVHQFAGGFDVETMTAFEELRDKARAYHIQGQNQQQQRQACKSMSC